MVTRHICIYPYGILYYSNHCFHRIAGPAVILNPIIGPITFAWYFKHNKIAVSSQKEFIRIMKLKVLW